MTNLRSIVAAPTTRWKRRGETGSAILTIAKLSVIAKINGYREKPIPVPISLARLTTIFSGTADPTGGTTGHQGIIPTAVRNKALPRQQRDDDQECDGQTLKHDLSLTE
jgi:hypothetical protein